MPDEQPKDEQVTTPPDAPAVEEKESEITPTTVGLTVQKDKTYSSDEVDKLLAEAVRKGAVTSKNQLNKELEKLRGEVKDLRNKSNETKSTADVEALALLNKKVEVLEEALTKQVVQNETLVKSVEQERLDNFKREIVAKAQGRIISELVTGNTKEELEASAKIAMEKFEKIEEELRRKHNLPTEQQKKDEETQSAIKTEVAVLAPTPVNQREWKAKRAEIAAKLYREAGVKV